MGAIEDVYGCVATRNYLGFGASADEVAGLLSLSTGTVRNCLNRLKEYGWVVQDYSDKVKRFWITTPKIKAETETLDPEPLPEPEKITPLTTIDLQGLLKRWSMRPWEPRVFSSAQALPMAIARLFEMAVAQTNDEPILPSELVKIRETVASFLSDIETLRDVVIRFIATPGLWNDRELALFLGVLTEPDVFEDLVFKLRELN